MKSKIFILFLISCFAVFNYSLKAQIPNSNFENWTNGVPAGWSCNNKPVLHFSPVSKTSDSQSGKYAVMGKVKPMGNAMSFAPVIYTGNPKDNKFSVTQRYSGITGYYKLKPVKGDQFVASVFMFKNGKQIGKGIKYFQTAKKYTQFKVKVKYKSKAVPDKCEMTFTIFPSFAGKNRLTVHKGSSMYLDDLAFLK